MTVSRKVVDKTILFDGQPLVSADVEPSLAQRYGDAYIYRQTTAIGERASRILSTHLRIAYQAFIADIAADAPDSDGLTPASRDWLVLANRSLEAHLTDYGNRAAQFTLKAATASFILGRLGMLWTLDNRFVADGVVNIAQLDLHAAARGAIGENVFGIWSDEDFILQLIGQDLRQGFADDIDMAIAEIRRTMRRSIADRQSFPQTARAVRDRLGLAKPGKMLGELTTLARSYTAAAASRGRVQAARENQHITREVQWDTMRDNRVCPICQPLQGRRWKLDDPNIPYPAESTHPNCVLGSTVIAAPGKIIGGFKSFYHGPVITIRTASGRELSCTKNHLILTRAGWQAAASLQVGQDVLTTSVSKRMLPSIYTDDQYGVRIQDVVESLQMSSGMRTISVPAAPKHFHNDGRFMHGNVDIVLAKRFLLNQWYTALPKPIRQFIFDIASMADITLSDLCTLDKLCVRAFHAAHSVMRFSNSTPLSIGALTRPMQGTAIGGMYATNSDTSLDKTRSQSLARYPCTTSQAVDAFASQVALDKIVEVRNEFLATDVYDLSIEPTPVYSSNGIISSNCRCDLLTVVRPAQDIADELNAELADDDSLPRRGFPAWLFDYGQGVRLDAIRNFTWE